MALGRRYRRLFTASTTANLGDGLLLVGVPLLAIELTREPVAIAGLQAGLTLPWLLFALHAGALADRQDRRSLLVGAAALRAVTLGAAGLAAAAGWLPLPVLYLTVFVVAAGEVLFDTTSQSLVPDLVERDQLGAANGRLIGAQTVMNNFVGAPLAGLLVGVAAAAVLLGPAVLYGLVALLLLRLPGRYRPAARSVTTMRADIVEGLRALHRDAPLRSVALLGGVFNMASAAYFGVFVLFVVGDEAPMGLPPAAYGAFAAMLAAGGVAGEAHAGDVDAVLREERAEVADDGGVRFTGEVADRCRMPVIAARETRLLIHPLLDDRPFTSSGQEEAVQIDLKPVSNGVVVHLCRQPAGTNKCVTIQSGPVGNGPELVRRIAGMTSAATADINAQLVRARIQTTLQSAEHGRGDARGMPIHPEHAPERLEPERIAQPRQQRTMSVVIKNRFDNGRAEPFHSLGEPHGDAAAVQRKVGGAGTLHPGILPRARRRRIVAHLLSSGRDS